MIGISDFTGTALLQVTEYDALTGRILTQSAYPTYEIFELNQGEGTGALLGHHNGNTHYILDGEVTERPTSPVTRTDLTLLAVPEGSTLWINGESYEAEGEVELEFPLPGTYRLRVECFPFLGWVDEGVVLRLPMFVTTPKPDAPNTPRWAISSMP